MVNDNWEEKYGSEWHPLNELENITERCPRCQAVLQTVDVNGHEQCAICHSVIDDCCQGAPLK